MCAHVCVYVCVRVTVCHRLEGYGYPKTASCGPELLES